jgi:uncharacterized membrane protein YhaH (DUF805 family)
MKMDFQSAVKTCFQKYVDFNGRATRSEFWWFFLFCFVVSLILGVISNYISWAFSLATILPTLAVGSRRLHDTNKSGWLQLGFYISYIIAFVLMGFGAASLMTSSSPNMLLIALGGILMLATLIVFIILMVKESDASENKYGDVPAN